jgi:hypothetical protein
MIIGVIILGVIIIHYGAFNTANGKLLPKSPRIYFTFYNINVTLFIK